MCDSLLLRLEVKLSTVNDEENDFLTSFDDAVEDEDADEVSVKCFFGGGGDSSSLLSIRYMLMLLSS